MRARAVLWKCDLAGAKVSCMRDRDQRFTNMDRAVLQMVAVGDVYIDNSVICGSVEE